jgi:hypothetical protein
LDCKSSVQVSSQWLGWFSHATDSDSCISYYAEEESELDLTKDSQFRIAQVTSVMVFLLGLPLWLALVASPFLKFLNDVWPKITSIVISLIIGNLQILNVVKFVRSVLDVAYPDDKVYYQSKGIVVCSVLFWFLTAIAIGLCGVKPMPAPVNNRRVPSNRERSSNEISKAASEDTKDTKEDVANELYISSSEDTPRDLEVGKVELHHTTSEETEMEEIELSLSASAGEDTLASF